ncbi:MAG: hypothetical protein IJM91_07680 [Lachnospiraceae bacterium]|nr:hypothetical protein [Lachnospiraceae bacterium]
MNEKLDALVLVKNAVTNWVQITTHGSRYTCETKMLDGVECFKFKNRWHSVNDYVGPNTEELIEENGKLISRLFKKK